MQYDRLKCREAASVPGAGSWPIYRRIKQPHSAVSLKAGLADAETRI